MSAHNICFLWRNKKKYVAYRTPAPSYSYLELCVYTEFIFSGTGHSDGNSFARGRGMSEGGVCVCV